MIKILKEHLMFIIDAYRRDSQVLLFSNQTASSKIVYIIYNGDNNYDI